MNWNVIKGNWKQLKGNVREQWGELNDDPVDILAGKREILDGRIRESYDITLEDAEARVSSFAKRQKRYLSVTRV